MSKSSAINVKIKTKRLEIDYDNPEIAEIVSERLPLAEERLTAEIQGPNTAVINSLRRVIKGELKGCRLLFDTRDMKRDETADKFMDDFFVNIRLRNIPIRYDITEEEKKVKFTLYAANNTCNVMIIHSKDLYVSEGRLSRPIFNPLHEVAFIQPGRTLLVKNIRIEEDYVTKCEEFATCARTVCKAIAEEYPKEETHSAEGSQSVLSGYVESSLVSRPTNHELSFSVVACPDDGGKTPRNIMHAACLELIRRLEYISTIAQDAIASETSLGVLFYKLADANLEVSSKNNLLSLKLIIKGEGDTLGNCMTSTINDLYPDINYVGYSAIPHENSMKLFVNFSGGDPAEVVQIVDNAAIALIDIYEQIAKACKV